MISKKQLSLDLPPPAMPLNVKPDQSRLTTLLTDTVVLLCKNGLNFQSTLRIVGVLGITIDDSDVFVVHLNEDVSSVTPDTPDVTSYTDSINKLPKTSSNVDGCRSFHTEKRVGPLTPRSGKSPGRASNISTDNLQESISKRSPEDGMMKADKGSLVESDHTSEIQIKEENVEVLSGETADRNLSFGPEDENSGTQASKRDKRAYRWTREIGHVSISDPVDYTVGSNEMFVRNERRVKEPRGGMDVTDEWNLDMLALSSLPGGAAEGDVVPSWPGYVWGGGGTTYSQECLSGEMSHSQSQPMVLSFSHLFIHSFIH